MKINKIQIGNNDKIYIQKIKKIKNKMKKNNSFLNNY